MLRVTIVTLFTVLTAVAGVAPPRNGRTGGREKLETGNRKQEWTQNKSKEEGTWQTVVPQEPQSTEQQEPCSILTRVNMQQSKLGTYLVTHPWQILRLCHSCHLITSRFPTRLRIQHNLRKLCSLELEWLIWQP